MALPPNNQIANMHYLTEYQSKKLKQYHAEFNDIIETIKKTQQLEGNWCLSQDFKWLIKVEE